MGLSLIIYKRFYIFPYVYAHSHQINFSNRDLLDIVRAFGYRLYFHVEILSSVSIIINLQ